MSSGLYLLGVYDSLPCQNLALIFVRQLLISLPHCSSSP